MSPEAAPYFRRKAYSRTQLAEAEHADGALTVSFETAGLDDARAFVMGWGALVRVLDPPALADAVAQAHREAAAQYSERQRCPGGAIEEEGRQAPIDVHLSMPKGPIDESIP